MIFVTVGTTHFDGLISQIDALVAEGTIKTEVYAQIGQGTYIPQHLEWFRYTDKIRELEEKADLVICHGGVGSIFELMELQKPFIAVPNRDVQDDHQADLLRALEADGSCHCCWDLAKLGLAIANLPNFRPRRMRGELASVIWDELSTVGPWKADTQETDQ